MSLTVTKAEGVTVFTVTSNPKSKWPLLCQILHTLCCSPACFVSRSMKQQLGSSHKVLGILQILVGVMNVGFGGFIRGLSVYGVLWGACFWLGAVFIATGIMCIIVEKFPSPSLISFSVLVNIVSFGLAITAIVFYSIDLSNVFTHLYFCSDSYGYRFHYYGTTPSPAQINEMLENCERYQRMVKPLHGGLDIMMIVLGVLQLCLTVSSCVLSLKALCKKKKEDQMEDPEIQKPLVEEVLSSP